MKKRDVRLNTSAHREAFDGFADQLGEIERREGWRADEVLRNFLDTGYRALRGRLLLGDAFAENEAAYMKVVASCRYPKETMGSLAIMLGETTKALLADPIDFLGPVFSEVSASSAMGQFFTPHALSMLNAQMILGDVRAMLEGKKFIRLHEPACGVGGMVLAANLVMREQGVDVARQTHWHVVDVDYRAICGAYIQLCLTDASATVIHGNTLSLESWGGAVTPAAVLFPKLDQERAPDIIAPAVTPPVQLSLL